MRSGAQFWRRIRSWPACGRWIRSQRWRQRRGGWSAGLRDSDGCASRRGARIRGRFSGGRGRLNGCCAAEGFLAQAQLEEALRGAVDKDLVRLPVGGVLLVGFDGMTPAQAMLVESLRSTGVEIQEFRPEGIAARRMLVEAHDEQEELRYSAVGAKDSGGTAEGEGRGDRTGIGTAAA